MDTAAPIHPHLRGMLAPLASEDEFELEVEGRVPDGLRGAYYRNGPNPRFTPAFGYHAFVGDGMIHGFFIDENGAHYRNRWVRTPRWLAENEAGRSLFGGMGLPSDPSVANIHGGGANTNIVSHAGKLMALQEASEPFEMDARTLNSRGFMHTGGKFTAHPKLDPETGEMVWFAYSAGEAPLNNLIDYGVTDASGRVTRRDRFAAPYSSMVHDFLVTRNYVLFPILPLTGDLGRAMRGGPAYAWEPQKGAFVGVMKRNDSVDTIRWFEIEPNYVFHLMNAWEEGEAIHADVMEYTRAPLFPNTDGTMEEGGPARLVRWTIDLKAPTNAVKRTPLDDLPGEFPRLDERFAGLPYRQGWFAANVGEGGELSFNALAHIDLRSGKREVRTFGPGDSVGEPVFAPRAPEAAEGDGWVIATHYRAAEDRSALLILDTSDFTGEPAASLVLPRRVPAGFHGNWVGV